MTGLRLRLRRLRILAVTFALLLPLAGCSSQFVFVPVKGKLTLKNKKLVTVGKVFFFPDGDNAFRQIPQGKINEDGTYELTTEGRSGAPIGFYTVCVRGPMRKVNGQDPPPIPYSMKYFDANESPLKVQVVANPAAGAYDFELTGN
jgi:hypothetical protein